MLGALFHHQNLSVALNDGGFDLANFFVHQHFIRKMAIENLLANFGHALWAQRVSRPRPAQRWLRLLIRLEQRLVRPLGRRRSIQLDPIQPVEYQPRAFGSNRDGLLDVLNWLVHVPGTFPLPVIELRPRSLAKSTDPLVRVLRTTND